MSDADITTKLRTILGDIAPDLDMSTVGPDEDLRNDIGLDSIDFLNSAARSSLSICSLSQLMRSAGTYMSALP